MNKFFKILFIMPLFLLNALSAHSYVDRDAAVITVMDKAAGKIQNYTIPVGTELVTGKLKINIRSCKHTDPFQAEDSFVFMEIYNAENKKIFSNWMSRNNPGAKPLQNADYDIWLVECE